MVDSHRARRERQRRCPACHEVVAIVRNPYFRVGLAVHPYFQFCRRCHTVTYLSSEPPASAPVPIAEKTSRARPRARWPFWRVARR